MFTHAELKRNLYEIDKGSEPRLNLAVEIISFTSDLTGERLFRAKDKSGISRAGHSRQDAIDRLINATQPQYVAIVKG